MRRTILTLIALTAGLGLALDPAWAQQYKPEFKNSLVVGPAGPALSLWFPDLLRVR